MKKVMSGNSSQLAGKMGAVALLWLGLWLVRSAAGNVPPPIDFSRGFGVNIHFSPQSFKAEDLSLLSEAGFKWIRTDVPWVGIEHEAGKYNFAYFEKFSDELEAVKMKALYVLDYGNPLYADPGDKKMFLTRINTDEFRRAYAAYSAATVAHFAGRGFVWEQWNEPNVKTFWLSSPDSAAYVALAKQACIEIRKKFPDEIIVGPATSGVDFRFIEACLRGGMLDYWSAITVHPYRHTAPETAADDYDRLRALIKKYAPPGREVPIICSEWGYSVAWSGFDEARTADHLTRMFQLSLTKDIPLTIWYDWRDDGDDPTNENHRFGLLKRSTTESFDPRPSFFSAREFLIRLRASTGLR